MTDAYATIKVLATTQGRRAMHVLVNQARRPGEGRAVRQQLQTVVDRYVNPGLDSPVRLDLLGDVPADSAVREAVLKRQLLMETLPGAPAAVAIAAIAAKLSE
jgi:flagellar biosynthesis protein FlhG